LEGTAYSFFCLYHFWISYHNSGELKIQRIFVA